MGRLCGRLYEVHTMGQRDIVEAVKELEHGGRTWW